MIRFCRLNRGGSVDSGNRLMVWTAGCKITAHPAQQRMIAVRCDMIGPEAGGVVNTNQPAAVIHHRRQLAHDAIMVRHLFGWKAIASKHDCRYFLQRLPVLWPL